MWSERAKNSVCRDGTRSARLHEEVVAGREPSIFDRGGNLGRREKPVVPPTRQSILSCHLKLVESQITLFLLAERCANRDLHGFRLGKVTFAPPFSLANVRRIVRFFHRDASCPLDNRS